MSLFIELLLSPDVDNYTGCKVIASKRFYVFQNIFEYPQSLSGFEIKWFFNVIYWLFSVQYLKNANGKFQLKIYVFCYAKKEKLVVTFLKWKNEHKNIFKIAFSMRNKKVQKLDKSFWKLERFFLGIGWLYTYLVPPEMDLKTFSLRK